MNTEQKYFWDESYLEKVEKEEEELSEDVVHILRMFDVLSIEDKVKIKKLIKNRDLW